jgi:hypothetical protein
VLMLDATRQSVLNDVLAPFPPNVLIRKLLSGPDESATASRPVASDLVGVSRSDLESLHPGGDCAHWLGQP